MKITINHRFAKNHQLIVGTSFTESGITYDVIDEGFNYFEILPDNPLTAWKRKTVY
jgi:hypothetical protein